MTRSTVETPETLMRYAIEGRLSKHALASLLTPPSRRAFLATCGGIEKAYTEACAATGEPCLESGCSCEGEACLEPLLRAGSDYHRSCGAEWVKLFTDGQNRDAAWKVTVSDYEIGEVIH